MTSEAKKKLFLVDGSGFIFRAYHALPPFSRLDGTPVGAVLGFSNMLFRLLENQEATYLAVIFDTARRTFRHDLYPAYKANRAEPPEDLIPQFALVREACTALNVPFLEQGGYEADDLIATLAVKATEENFQTTIVSSDKDLMQLVNASVSLWDPMKNRPIGPAEVVEKFGVGPDRVIDVQALAGDSSDNVPGVPGIGPKTAALLIQEYGDLESLLARATEIKQPKRRESLIDHAAAARLSYDLVTLKKDVPLAEDLTLDSFKRAPLDPDRLFPFLETNQFKTLKARVLKLGLRPPTPLPASFEGIAEHEGNAVTENAGRGELPASPEITSVTTPAAIVAEAPASSASASAISAATTASALAQVLITQKNTSPQYEVIQDEATLDKWIQRLQTAGLFAFDTETTSLDPMRATLVGISLSSAPGQACYIPVGHQEKAPEGDLFGGAQKATGPTQIPLDTVLERLKPLFQEPGLLKIAHNAKYDLTVLRRYGMTCASLEDTMVMSYVLDGTQNGHGLDELAEKHLAHQTIAFEEVAGKGKDQITFDYVPLEKATPYAAEDADIALRLYHLFKARLFAEKRMTVYETLDRPLLPVLLEMELTGVKIDTAQLIDLSQLFKEKMGVLEQEIHTLGGSVFNVGSPQQLAKVLFEDLNLATGKKGKSGTYSTSADVLEELALEGHEIAEKVIAWRQFSKLKSTYTDALVRDINPHTKRVHTSFAMTVTSTGRLSSRNPNLQNIPIRTEEGRKIRQAFVAEPQHVLISLDYSQIELRLLAHMADISSLKEAFRQGVDIHAQTAAEVFNLPLAQVEGEHRRRAKAINFGIIYGISAFGLARQLKISRTDAKAYIDAYCEKYPGILAYMEHLKQVARDQGYVETLFGRRCFIGNIKSKNPALRSFAERQAINAPLQGTASDIIKRAMGQVGGALEQAGLSPHLILQVHDELVFEACEEEAEKVAHLSKKVMESVASLSVPLKVDFGIAPCWGEAH